MLFHDVSVSLTVTVTVLWPSSAYVWLPATVKTGASPPEELGPVTVPVSVALPSPQSMAAV